MEKWRVTKIELDDSKRESARYPFKEFTTDTHGNILDETEYNPDNTVCCKRTYRYFPDHAVQEYVMFDPFDELLERHTYIEGTSGEVKKVIIEYSDGQKTVKEFQFTDLGSADRAVLTDENGEVTGFETYVVDEEGNVVEEIESGPGGELVSKVVKRYEAGLLLSEKKFFDGKLAEELSYSYDDRGNVVEKRTTDTLQHVEVIDAYVYDAENNLVRNTSYRDGVMIFDNQCMYEKSKLVVEEFFELDFWERRILRHERLLHEKVD